MRLTFLAPCSYAPAQQYHFVRAPSVVLVLGEPWAPALLLSATALSAFGLRDSAIGHKLTAPMLAFAFALSLSNAGLLPASHPLYEQCTTTVLPLSVALGLLAAAAPQLTLDGRPVVATRGQLRPMLLAFALGALGSVCGSFVAWALCTRTGLFAPPAAACAAGLMAATCTSAGFSQFPSLPARQHPQRSPRVSPSQTLAAQPISSAWRRRHGRPITLAYCLLCLPLTSG